MNIKLRRIEVNLYAKFYKGSLLSKDFNYLSCKLWLINIHIKACFITQRKTMGILVQK